MLCGAECFVRKHPRLRCSFRLGWCGYGFTIGVFDLDYRDGFREGDGSAAFHQFVGRLDGGGTFAVIETDNPADIANTTAKFGPYVEYRVDPVQDIADTVVSAREGLAFRESVS